MAGPNDDARPPLFSDMPGVAGLYRLRLGARTAQQKSAKRHRARDPHGPRYQIRHGRLLTALNCICNGRASFLSGQLLGSNPSND